MICSMHNQNKIINCKNKIGIETKIRKYFFERIFNFEVYAIIKIF